MAHTKPMKQIDVFAMIGGIFTFVGGTFTGVGTWFLFNLEAMVRNGSASFEGDMDEGTFSMLILGMGALTLALGLFLIAKSISKKHREKRLVRAGRHVWAEVVDVQYDWSTRINRRPALVLLFREDASDLGSREFRAGPFMDAEELHRAPRARAKVYIDPESDDYFVDISTMEYSMN